MWFALEHTRHSQPLSRQCAELAQDKPRGPGPRKEEVPLYCQVTLEAEILEEQGGTGTNESYKTTNVGGVSFTRRLGPTDPTSENLARAV